MKELEITLDYLTVTIPATGLEQKHVLNKMLQIFNKHDLIIPESSIIYCDYGLNLYKKMIKIPQFFTIFYENANKQSDTVCLNISGDGFERMTTENLNDLFEYFREIKPHCSRMDVACTDYAKKMPVDQLLEDVQKWADGDELNKIRTKKYKTTLKIYTAIRKDNTTSKSFSIGARRSDCFVRMYDKALEQGWDDTYAYRLEYELHRDKAIESFNMLLKGKNIVNVFLYLFDEIFEPVYKIDVNISHADIKKYWLEFKDYIIESRKEIISECRKIINVRQIKSIDNMQKWIKRISASFYTYIVLNSGDITQIIDEGKVKAENHSIYAPVINAVNAGTYCNEVFR